jgi:plasmid stabilization system protein ParE
MPRVDLAPAVLDDFAQLLDHPARFEPQDVVAWIGMTVQALEGLTHSPLIGRAVQGSDRELVVGRCAHGYIALYRYVPEIDTVFVLAIRRQRELGYKF